MGVFRLWLIAFYTTLTNLSTLYLVMCNVYTDVGGIKYLYHVCPPVRKIILSLKLVNYLHVLADNPWYNYYMFGSGAFFKCGPINIDACADNVADSFATMKDFLNKK